MIIKTGTCKLWSNNNGYRGNFVLNRVLRITTGLGLLGPSLITGCINGEGEHINLLINVLQCVLKETNYVYRQQSVNSSPSTFFKQLGQFNWIAPIISLHYFKEQLPFS